MNMLALYNAEHKARSLRLGGKSNIVFVDFKREPAVVEPREVEVEQLDINIIEIPAVYINEKPQALLEGPDLDRTPTIREVIIAVARETKITSDQLIGVKRCRSMAVARHIAFYLCYTFADKSLNQIARDFKRDHSTIGSGIRKIEKRLLTDGKTQDLVSLLTRRIAPLRAAPYWGA